MIRENGIIRWPSEISGTGIFSCAYQGRNTTLLRRKERMMTDAKNVRLAGGGMLQYQNKHGLNRAYPSNGVPQIDKRELSAEEKAVISAPLIKHAREQKVNK